MTTQPNQLAFAWAQTTGAAHQLRGAPCEDAMGLTTITDQNGTTWIIAAVADGAGSAPCAGEGSRIATEYFIEGAAETIFKSGADDLACVLRTAAVFARTMLELVAEDAARPLGDYHTTLLGCITNGQVTGYLQIGDGLILARDPSGTWRPVFEPQNGEERNYTYFLTLPEAFDLLQVKICDAPKSHVAMTTDGLQDILVYYKTGEVRPGLLDRIVSALTERRDHRAPDGDTECVSRGLHDVLDGESIRCRSSDDTSLLTIHLPPQD